MMQPVASALPVFESVRTYVTVSPGAGPTVAVAAAHEVHEPLKVMVGAPVQPLPGLVMVTPVTLYGPESAAEGFVLTSAVTPVQPLPEMVTVGGVAYVPPAVTLAKTTRFADGVAVSISARTGFAVMVTEALEVRGVGL